MSAPCLMCGAFGCTANRTHEVWTNRFGLRFRAIEQFTHCCACRMDYMTQEQSAANEDAIVRAANLARAQPCEP